MAKNKSIICLLRLRLGALILLMTIFGVACQGQGSITPMQTDLQVETLTQVPSVALESTATLSFTATLQPTSADIPTVIPPTAIPPPPEFPIFGVEISNERDITWVEQLGTSWVRRNGLKWHEIEPDQGIRLWENVATLENELVQFSEMGQQVILIVRGAPEWAQLIPGKPCGPIKSEAMSTFVDFLQEAVTRFSQPPYNIKYWELGNEPDVDPSLLTGTGPFGCWGDLNDADYYGGGNYASLLKVAYPAIKEIDPEAQVLIGGLLMDCDPVRPAETSPGSGQFRYCTPSKYLEGILANGGGDFFDGVSFHAYDYYNGGVGKYSNGNWFSTWDTTGPVITAKVSYIQAVLASYGQTGKSLFNTENALLCGRDGKEPECQTEEFNHTKASYVVQSSTMALAEGLDANVWYDLRGWRGSTLVDMNDQPTRAYLAYQFNIRMMDNMAFSRRMNEITGVSGYEFRQGTQMLWIMWSNDGKDHQISLPDSVESLYDIYGNSVPIAQKITVTITPIYIKWFADQ